GGTWSTADAINDRNQITGQAYTRNNFEAHAFRLSNGTMTDLGTLGHFYSWGLAINNSGTVVGRATIPDNSEHAFISTNRGRMQDLNTMIPAGSGWVLAEATAINDAGQIAGYGTVNGEEHAFLLTPQ